MPKLTQSEIRQNAVEFVHEWKDESSEHDVIERKFIKVIWLSGILVINNLLFLYGKVCHLMLY